MRLSHSFNTNERNAPGFYVPSFGMLNCHTLSNSSNKASNAWSTLSSSSISKTQGLSHATRAAAAGTEELLAVQLRPQGFPIHADGLGFEFNAKPLQGFIELPMAFFVIPHSTAGARRLVRCVRNCICQLSLTAPGGPSSSNGFCSLAAR